MSELSDQESVGKRQREQMLKLVTKGFYNELINYGVRKDEILKVASNLLDNLMAQGKSPDASVQHYSDLFTLSTVQDQWQEHRRLGVQHVTLRPLQPKVTADIARWLENPLIRQSFVPAFPGTVPELRDYFSHPARDYFAIFHNELPVGIIGGENIDTQGGKLEMKKLVGESGLQAKGIGKRATFGFLYYTFTILKLNKVYIHSRDINIRNINLNSRFGFELEGIFLDDIKVGDKCQDVVRMALFKSTWLEIFAPRG